MNTIETAIHSIAESETHVRQLKQHIAQLEACGMSTERARKLLEQIKTLLATKIEILHTLQSMPELEFPPRKR